MTLPLAEQHPRRPAPGPRRREGGRCDSRGRRWTAATGRVLRTAACLLSAAAPLWGGEGAPNPSQAKGPVTLSRRLHETWRVDAQGPVHLRKKSVEITYWLRITPRPPEGDGKPTCELTVSRVAVALRSEAQRRQSDFDSQTDSADEPIAHHELARPIAHLGQSLQLVFDPARVLREVKGTETLLRRLDATYARDFAGSEQGLYTHDPERGRLEEPVVREDWRELVRIPLPVEPVGAGRDATRPFLACIPSESWMRRIELPVIETVVVADRPGGGSEIRTTASLRAPQSVTTEIGPSKWVYEPRQVSGETTLEVAGDGTVLRYHSRHQATLGTTLTVSMDVPIEMTIEHVRELTPE